MVPEKEDAVLLSSRSFAMAKQASLFDFPAPPSPGALPHKS